MSPKCSKKDTSLGDLYFETWTGRENPDVEVCSVSKQSPVRHVVRAENWKGYSVSVAFRCSNTSNPPRLLFDFPPNPKQAYWEVDRNNPMKVPGAKPRRPVRKPERAIVEPTGVTNIPDEVIEVTLAYRPHLPKAGWVPVSTLDIQVDIK